ncbi:zinc ribbon domain-containing protein [Amphritea sp. 1_MG-2023]|uniref:zinc ribbon domain-containing protein n=1 Tax=Amphritea sp. 1_MG-2023 TaxID=3062670 RepID=UPI0026E457D4|nr:zinc ribbon domain-containing protein [Amphritea sp. 1_MG-2023]MDO6564816.1 zinc ribbon domain-containing protein [Amphritea sp. 1_MG-2023]
MPIYDYRCEATGKVFEVRHPMTLKLSTWADLCDIGGFSEGTTPMNTAVTQLANTDRLIHHKTIQNPEPPCMRGDDCPGHCGT